MSATRQQLEQEQYYSNDGAASPIWQDAFLTAANQKWLNLNIKGLNEHAETVSYQTALASFINSGDTAVKQRQKLLFSFLKATGFSSILPTDSIRRHYNALPTSNLFVTKVLKNLCTNYMQPPTRELQDIKTKKPVTDKVAIELFNYITSQTGFNYKLLKAHRIGKLCGSVACRPRVRRNELQLQILTPDKYQSIHDDYGNLLEMYIPFNAIVNKPGTNETTTELRYDYWDKDFYRVLNEKGEPIPFMYAVNKFNPDTETFINSESIELTELRHGYGRIPFEILNFDTNDGDNTLGTEDLWELIKAQLICNALDYMAFENVAFSAISMWVMTNMGLGSQARISPGMAFVREGVKIPDVGELAPPEVDSVAMQTYFSEINELKKEVQLQAMKLLGLPNSLVLDNPGLASGEALKVDYRELEMLRYEDIELLKPFEKRLLGLTLTIANVDPASPFKGQVKAKYDYSIDYKELYSNEKTKDEIEVLESKKTAGVITPLEYLRGYKVDDTIETDEQAIEYIKKNKEFFKQITEVLNDGENINAGTATQGNREGESGQAESPIRGNGTAKQAETNENANGNRQNTGFGKNNQ